MGDDPCILCWMKLTLFIFNLNGYCTLKAFSLAIGQPDKIVVSTSVFCIIYVSMLKRTMLTACLFVMI